MTGKSTFTAAGEFVARRVILATSASRLQHDLSNALQFSRGRPLSDVFCSVPDTRTRGVVTLGDE